MRATKIARIIFDTVDRVGEVTGLGPLEIIGEFGTGILNLAGIEGAAQLSPTELWTQIIEAKDTELARMNQSVVSVREKLERNRRHEAMTAGSAERELTADEIKQLGNDRRGFPPRPEGVEMPPPPERPEPDTNPTTGFSSKDDSQ
ncbi:MAG: hypothetical protein V3R83_09855 [Gammaproteobacteria bacterium]